MANRLAKFDWITWVAVLAALVTLGVWLIQVLGYYADEGWNSGMGVFLLALEVAGGGAVAYAVGWLVEGTLRLLLRRWNSEAVLFVRRQDEEQAQDEETRR